MSGSPSCIASDVRCSLSSPAKRERSRNGSLRPAMTSFSCCSNPFPTEVRRTRSACPVPRDQRTGPSLRGGGTQRGRRAMWRLREASWLCDDRLASDFPGRASGRRISKLHCVESSPDASLFNPAKTKAAHIHPPTRLNLQSRNRMPTISCWYRCIQESPQIRGAQANKYRTLSPEGLL